MCAIAGYYGLAREQVAPKAVLDYAGNFDYIAYDGMEIDPERGASRQAA